MFSGSLFSSSNPTEGFGFKKTETNKTVVVSATPQ